MTSLALSHSRARFLRILWLSIALHAAVIGLARLPPQTLPNLPAELQVSLSSPVKAAVAVEQATKAAQLLPVPPKPAAAVAEPAKAAPPAPQSVDSSRSVEMESRQVAPPVSQPATAASPASMPARIQAEPEVAEPQLSIPRLQDTRYYTVKEVDVLPAALRKPDPVYPPRAEALGVTGSVLLRLNLEADGAIVRTEVISVAPSGMFGDLFRQSALESVQGLRFRPAKRNGIPVRAVVEFRVVFEQDGP